MDTRLPEVRIQLVAQSDKRVIVMSLSMCTPFECIFAVHVRTAKAGARVGENGEPGAGEGGAVRDDARAVIAALE